ncbi:hypothetical protein E6W36_01000 [Hankyongella ginsenosidimutans]|uniref:Uncharacterized protein n=1 Tax=Hankyongella ginsenosidimutans TaxID=1763828 RepID=A0A4D7C0Z9_9SPHN|nr:hypothetical protein [Hankyongella ginsenosidimutans]QCI78721.1 hypothetical protein E6W36_01000 [Hankyongella ginsenosidimutans]
MGVQLRKCVLDIGRISVMERGQELNAHAGRSGLRLDAQAGMENARPPDNDLEFDLRDRAFLANDRPD